MHLFFVRKLYIGRRHFVKCFFIKTPAGRARRVRQMEGSFFGAVYSGCSCSGSSSCKAEEASGTTI